MPRKGVKEASQKIFWIRKLVSSENAKFSGHLYDKIRDGEFGLEDIECSIANGKILKTMKDEEGGAVDGKKYVIAGRCKGGLGFETVGKIMNSDDGDSYFFITAYRRI